MSSPNLFFSTPIWVSKIDNYKETNEKISKHKSRLNKWILKYKY